MLALLISGALPGVVGAQVAPSAASMRVVRIEVEGNQKVPTASVLQWFAVRPGDPFDPRRVARATKALTEKGRFADVRVEGEPVSDGVVLYVIVEEYPRLSEVRIEGANRIKESDLRAEMALGPRTFLTPWQLRDDVEKVTKLYRDKGFYSASVRDTLLTTDTGDFALLLRVDEGQKASIQSIAFVGNNSLTDKRLRKQMETSEDGFWGGGDLKADVLQQDFEKIVQFYHSHGYLDARVAKHDIALGDNGRDLTLTIHVDEGPQYVVGTVDWMGNTVFPDPAVGRVVQLIEGQPFNQAAFEATTQALYELYQDKGYFYFTATPRRDVRGQVVNVTYILQEGQQARLNHVRIVGNTKTHDKVVLREFALLPGDTFDRSRLTRSLRDVFQLGFFEDVNIPPEGIRPRDDGSVDVDLRVVERQTGQLGAGAGYSAVNALTGFFEMAETNLFGTGKRLSFRWEFSRNRNDINFSYTQPWVFDTPTTLTLDLFNFSGRSNINAFYRSRRLGAGVRVGRRLDILDFTTAAVRFRAERVTFTDFSSIIPDSTRNSLSSGQRRISAGFTLRRNSTDNPFFPSSGTDASLSMDLFGTFLGGDQSYLDSALELSWFQRVGLSKLTLALRTRFGLLRGLENRIVPNDELFRLGGVFFNGVRGYDEFEIVPEGNAAFDGGQAMSIFVAELRYPFTPRVHGAVFLDAGNTWNSFGEADFSNLRKGAGLGLRIEVPMLGLIGLDYAYGFDRVDALGRNAASWNFHFRFGNLF
ncbi:MAG: outer membrane protein assembly factor BamA [Candidatus Latescibacterota bacterium]|nr:MAG: outer membrane protein assembly factor BamA [Candidatus Latescibacterota bacterium]